MEKHIIDLDDQLKQRFDLKRDINQPILYEKGYVLCCCNKPGTVVVINTLNLRDTAMMLDKITRPIVCLKLNYPYVVTVHDKGNERDKEKGWIVRTFDIITKVINILQIQYPSPSERGKSEKKNRSSMSILENRVRHPQRVLFDKKLLLVASPDMLFLWLHDQMVFREADRLKPAARVPLQISQGIRFSSLDSETNLLVLGAADMFQVWNLNNLQNVCEGRVSKSYQTFHNIKLVENTIISTTADCIQLWNVRRNFEEKYNNPTTIPISQPISHLSVDHHHVLAGNLSGAVHLRNLYDGSLLRILNPYDTEWGGGIEFGDGLLSNSDGFSSPSKTTGSIRKKSGMFVTTERKVDCVARYGDWVFCAYADPNLCFTIWERKTDEFSEVNKPVKTYKFKERVFRIILDPEEGRIILLLKSNKKSVDSGTLYIRIITPKLSGFGSSSPEGKAMASLEGYSWQHRLGLCRAKNLEIIAFLIAAPKLKELTAEFGPNLGELQYGLSEVLWSTKETPHLINLSDVQTVDKIYLLLFELQAKLNEIVNKSKIRRVLSSISLRSRLEHLNSSLYKSFQDFKDVVVREENEGWLDESVWGVPASFRKAKPKRDANATADDTHLLGSPTSEGSPTWNSAGTTLSGLHRYPSESHGAGREGAGDDGGSRSPTGNTHPEGIMLAGRRASKSLGVGSPERRRSTLSQSLASLNAVQKEAMSEGAEGWKEWEYLFGERNYVTWETFIDRLETKIGREISETEVDMIAHVIDNSGTGFVSRNKFTEWLKGFGPLTNALDNTKLVICEPWFHGFLSHTEAHLLLQNEEVGSFLVRFSESQPGGFTLAFVYLQDGTTRVLQTQIQNNPNVRGDLDRFIVKQRSATKTFNSVQDIIAAYTRLLKVPYHSSLLEKPWFLGDLSGDESRELLQGEQIGRFLIRFSASNPGNFALSFVNASGEVAHSSIKRTSDGGYKTGHSDFKTMDELVSAYSELLKIPYVNTRSSIYDLKRSF